MSNYATLVESLGAIAHWRLGEDNSPLAVDEIGSRHAAWNNIPESTNGLINHDSDKAQAVTNNRALTVPFDDTGDFTVCILTQTANQSQFGTLFQNGNTSNGWRIIMHDGFYGPGNRIQVLANFVGLIFVGSGLLVGLKYLLTIARRSGQWEFWINEIQQESVAGVVPNPATAGLSLGGAYNAAECYQGTLDEVAIFPTALLATDILELTKTAYLTTPTAPAVTVGDNGTGGDTFTLSTAATPGSFPLAGYAIWESDSSDEDSFEFDRQPAESIAVGETFEPRLAARGKHYAIRAFDDRTEPNYGSPTIVASEAVPVESAVDVGAIVAAIKADAALGTADGGMVANAASAKAEATTAAAQSTIAANASVAARKLGEADDILENEAGVQVLNKYERGTSTKLVPTKRAKKVGGGDLTNPTSQRWAGYRE